MQNALKSVLEFFAVNWSDLNGCSENCNPVRISVKLTSYVGAN
jgi:hypothetical protein